MTASSAAPREQISALCGRLMQEAAGTAARSQENEPFSLQTEPVTNERIFDRRAKCVQILVKWKATALLRKQQQAQEDCDFILSFIKDICR